MKPKWKSALKWIAILAGAGAFAVQLVPYGRAHENPPVVKEPTWASGATRDLAARACFDCHSNQTHWPWYSHLAPASWLVQRHVDEGRLVLNFSEWNRSYDEAHEASETVLEGEMPPASYLVAHPEARLTAAEKSALARGLAATTRGPEAGSTERDHD